jgi:hypothetical protein
VDRAEFPRLSLIGSITASRTARSAAHKRRATKVVRSEPSTCTSTALGLDRPGNSRNTPPRITPCPSAGCIPVRGKDAERWHWVHLRTTNPIESTFAIVRSRTKVTKRPGPRAAGLATAYKLIEATESPVARAQRAAPGRPRPRRRRLPHRKAPRTTRRHHARRTRQITRNEGRLKQPHPPVLTITRLGNRAVLPTFTAEAQTEIDQSQVFSDILAVNLIGVWNTVQARCADHDEAGQGWRDCAH